MWSHAGDNSSPPQDISTWRTYISFIYIKWVIYNKYTHTLLWNYILNLEGIEITISMSERPWKYKYGKALQLYLIYLNLVNHSSWKKSWSNDYRIAIIYMELFSLDLINFENSCRNKLGMTRYKKRYTGDSTMRCDNIHVTLFIFEKGPSFQKRLIFFLTIDGSYLMPFDFLLWQLSVITSRAVSDSIELIKYPNKS